MKAVREFVSWYQPVPVCVKKVPYSIAHKEPIMRILIRIPFASSIRTQWRKMPTIGKLRFEKLRFLLEQNQQNCRKNFSQTKII